MEIGEEAPELGAEPLSLTSDTPLLRAQIKHSIEDAQAFGTRLKSVHKLADSYAQALNTAAACWVELIAELREVAVDLPISDEGEQVAASLKGLSEQVVQVLAAPLRAFYDNEIKPIRETKKSYDKVRQKYDDAERRSLSLKHQAEPDKVRQADEELRAKKWQLELQRFDMYAELESVQLRRKLLPQHAADFLHAHVACFHTSFGVLSAMETRSMVERVEAMGVTLEERKQLRQRERLQVAGQSQRHGTALSPGEQGAREAVVVADAELGSQQQGLLFHQVSTTLSRTFSPNSNGAGEQNMGRQSKKFKRRWCVVSDGYMFVYRWKGKDQINVGVTNVKVQLNLLLCSVKPDDAKIRFCFLLVNQNGDVHRFQAGSEADMRTWLACIQNAIGSALNAQPLLPRTSYDDGFEQPDGSASNVAVSRKRSFERQKQATLRLQALLSSPGNAMCADCSTSSHLTWAAINLGIFLCIDCAGIHRGLGTHISKVRSLELDTREWSESQLELM